MDYLVRYGHYLGFMVLFAALVASHLALAGRPTGHDLRRAATLDNVFLAAAVVVLVTGLAQLSGHGFGKQASWYMSNGVFHAKLTLFLLVLLSAVPVSIAVRRRRAGDAEEVSVPRHVRMIQRFQMLAVLALPVLGLLLARGVGARAS